MPQIPLIRCSTQRRPPRPLFSAGLLAWGLFTSVGVGCAPDDPGSSDNGPAVEATNGPRGGAANVMDEATTRPKSVADAPSTSARFVERAQSAAVQFVYRNGQETGHYSILETLGGGAAVLDFDGDGGMDLFFPGGGEFEGREIRGRPPALYRAVGNWQYAAATEAAGVGEAPWYSHGAAVCDFDQDGFLDILVTGYGGLLLFWNQGDGTFREIGREAGLVDPLWSSCAAWGDLTGDGHPDLYVTHYVNWSFDNNPFCYGPGGSQDVCSPRKFDPLPDSLFVSNGDGSFRDASIEAGLRDDGKGLAAMIADVDVDGDLDVYVANDTVENFLYLNDGTGRFEERSSMSGTGLSQAGTPDGSMGVDLGDYNLDGLPDLWVTNFEHESIALYRNMGNGMFLHSSRAAGVTAVGALYVGWGAIFFDVEQDGDEDVFVSNGHVFRHPTSAPVLQQPLLFQNDGGRFRNVAPAAGGYMTTPHNGRGVAAGDLDGDGDLDLAVSHVNEPVALLENESTGGGNSLCLRLIGRASPRDPVGAVVTVRTGDGRQTRQQKGGGSYASTNDPRLFFGLGAAEQIDELQIRWPSGALQILKEIPANRPLTIVEPHAAVNTPVEKGDWLPASAHESRDFVIE